MTTEITNSICIKDLPIFQSAIKPICDDINRAKRNGVDIGELVINQYVYESNSSNVCFMTDYIHSLSNLIELFNELYNTQLYELRIDDIVRKNQFNANWFQFIFKEINNAFNSYISDRYLFDDFGIYYSETSLITIPYLYNVFSDNFILLLNGILDNDAIKLIKSRISKEFIYNHLYDRIFEQFEDLYLPFY